jgi:hypothetical protein
MHGEARQRTHHRRQEPAIDLAPDAEGLGWIDLALEAGDEVGRSVDVACFGASEPEAGRRVASTRRSATPLSVATRRSGRLQGIRRTVGRGTRGRPASR